MSSLLDAFGIETHLLLAQLVNFAVLFGVLSYLLYKPVLKTLEERRIVLAKGVEDAKRASDALDGAKEKAHGIEKQAETNAEGIVSLAESQATARGAQIVTDAQVRAEHIEKDAHARAKEASERTLRESEKEISRLAILAAEKAMRASA